MPTRRGSPKRDFSLPLTPCPSGIPLSGGTYGGALLASPIGVPAEAQPVRYPQGVCRIRSAAKLLTAALLGSVGKGGDAQ